MENNKAEERSGSGEEELTARPGSDISVET